jgi:hypothetical protein
MSSEKKATTLWPSENSREVGLTPVAPSAGLTSMILRCLVSATVLWASVVYKPPAPIQVLPLKPPLA